MIAKGYAKRTRSKSLGVYRQKYQPELSFKLVGTMGNIEDNELKVLPHLFCWTTM
jgi:hypothetical protein